MPARRSRSFDQVAKLDGRLDAEVVPQQIAVSVVLASSFGHVALGEVCGHEKTMRAFP